MNPVRTATAVVSAVAVVTGVFAAYAAGDRVDAIPDAGQVFHACALVPAAGQRTPVLIVDPATTTTCPAGDRGTDGTSLPPVVKYVDLEGPHSTVSRKRLTLTCGAGYRVLSGGGRIEPAAPNNRSPDFAITSNRPLNVSNRVIVADRVTDTLASVTDKRWLVGQATCERMVPGG